MSIVASPTSGCNLESTTPPAEALAHLRAALAERVALARSLPDAPSASECATFTICDEQVQAQIDAWLGKLAEAGG